MPTFVPRLNDNGIRTSPWYVSNQNPFEAAGYGMPNCTCYAYGRYAEARNAWANLPTSDAKDWYGQATAFTRSATTPALGSVICWGCTGSGPGHVGIVETIASNGDIQVSMSHWSARTNPNIPYWELVTIYAADVYEWGWLGSDYYFQGFIYNDWGAGPGPGPGPTPTPPPTGALIQKRGKAVGFVRKKRLSKY